MKNTEFDLSTEVRLSVRVPLGMRREFKVETARAGLDMSQLVREWIGAWLEERKDQTISKNKGQ